jgi:hypothetical protein
MLKTLTSIAFAVALAATASASAVNAAPIQVRVDLPSLTIQVSEDCGPYAWHGPWGHCRSTPFHGRLPNGQWV